MSKRGVLHRIGIYPNMWSIKSESGTFTVNATNLADGLTGEGLPQEIDVIFDARGKKAVNIRAADANIAQQAVAESKMQQEKREQIAEAKDLEAAETVDAARRSDAAKKAHANLKRLKGKPRPKGEFRNPYNFIPAPEPKCKNGPLGQGSPISQQRWDEERVSGRLRLKMTAVTPLLLPEAPEVDDVDGIHKIYRTRRNSDGAPIMPVTSLKGALRSGYEAVTNSRLSQLNVHKAPLGYRMEASEGLKMVPARIKSVNKLELFLGSHAENDANVWPTTAGPPNREMYAAWLPRYGNRGVSFSPTNGRSGEQSQTRENTDHGKKIWCTVQKVKRLGARSFKLWQVCDYVAYEDGHAALDLSARAIRSNDYQPIGEPRLAWGYICATNQNIGKKHDERVFFLFENAEPLSRDVPDALRIRYNSLVRDYRRIAEAQRDKWAVTRNAWEFTGPDISATAQSRHCYGPLQELGPDSLCYAKVDQNGNVIDLFPVMISRTLYATSPRHLLPSELLPALSLSELSSADRVFGWTTDSGDGGRRGLVRIMPPECETKNAIETVSDGGSLPLAILGQPKPEQSRFYASPDSSGQAPPEGAEAHHLYQPETGLRGRKVYPHHRHLAGDRDYWDINAAARQDGSRMKDRTREFVRTRPTKGNITDSQNRSIRDWVKIGAEFSVDIEVFNLSTAELGALLFTLSPADNGHLRIGGGKPLGFGSVKVEIEEEELFTGLAKKIQLKTFESKPQCDVSIDKAKDVFKDAISGAYGRFEEVPFIKAWIQTATGHKDDLPVHYPRRNRRPHPDGNNYEWFTQNARKSKHALADLEDDPGLPYL